MAIFKLNKFFMLLTLLLIPLLGIFIISSRSDFSASSSNEIKTIGLTTSILNLLISLVIWILFDFSQNQFQFVQEYHQVSFCDFYLGVDGLSIYFVILTTIIMPIALLSNWSSIRENVKSYVIIILLLETLLLAVFLVLDIFLFYVFFESTYLGELLGLLAINLNNGFGVRSYSNSTTNGNLNSYYLTGLASKKALVVFGTNLTSQVGSGRFSKQVSNMIKLAPYQQSVIIGLLLSDGWLIFARPHSKSALALATGFKQSLNHSQYVLFVFNILSHYCSSGPQLTSGVRTGNRFYGLAFYTRSLPCLTEIHLLFYLNKIKMIPQNIYELLTPVAYCHLIMGDGSVERHGLTLCTNSYSIEDVVRLLNVLMIRYGLECTLRLKRRNQKIEYMIYIRQRSMPLLRSIVTPYFHPSMLYKLGS